MTSIFSKIVEGVIPSYKIDENEKYFAFLDINPLSKGHTLVIPKKEIDYIFDLSDVEFSELFLYAKKIAKAIDKAYPSLKIGIAVLGLEVAHAHIHLVPQHDGNTLNFKNQKLKISDVEYLDIVKNIQKELL